MKDKRITIRLTDQQLKLIKHLAEKTGDSVSHFVRKLILKNIAPWREIK